MTALIPRNTTIPTEKTEVFSTAEDNQTVVEIHVLQGERKMALDNKTIGKFQLTGIPPAPRGMPQIQVTFDIDANGILNVSAKDNATGKEQKIRIESSSGLSDSEIDKMVQDAEAHATEDEEKREQVDARNQLDSLVYQAEKDSAEWEDKVSDESKQNLKEALDSAKTILSDQQASAEDMNGSRDDLMQAFSAAGQEMYQAQAASDEEGGETPEDQEESDDDVVEADYEIVDE